MKKPKMPKRNASLSTWKRYEQKLKEYEEVNKIRERARAKAARL